MHRVRNLLLAGAMVLAPSVAEGTTILVPIAPGWEYTFTNPTSDPTWNTTTGTGGPFGWATGSAPFGNVTGGVGGADPLGYFDYNTYWAPDGSDGDDLWVRRAVDFTGFDLSTITWDLGVDNGFTLYLNGTLITSANAEFYTFRWEYSGLFGSAIQSGVNILAVALEDHGGLTAFDMQISGTPAAVPEPSALLLVLGGLAALGVRRYRRGA